MFWGSENVGRIQRLEGYSTQDVQKWESTVGWKQTRKNEKRRTGLTKQFQRHKKKIFCFGLRTNLGNCARQRFLMSKINFGSVVVALCWLSTKRDCFEKNRLGDFNEIKSKENAREVVADEVHTAA
jgi:hypothetical protein